jgi:phospholipase/lecithinase/hemolysin
MAPSLKFVTLKFFSSAVSNFNCTITEYNRKAEVNIMRLFLAHLTALIIVNLTQYGFKNR